MDPVITEKEYLNLFKVSLFLKALSAMVEIFCGFLVWFISKASLVIFLLDIFHNELTDSPQNFIADFIVNFAAALSVSSRYVLTAYLLTHGIVKMVLIIELMRKKLWAYPASIVIFTLLIIYEFYRYSITNSSWMLAFTILDIIVVLLTIHEYGVLKRKQRRLQKI